MSALTKLNDTEVQGIVDLVLGERWRDIGYDHAEVTSEVDVYGEPALTVTAWLKDGSPLIPIDIYSPTLLDLRDAIRARGEERYAYVHLRRSDDSVLEDDPSDQSGRQTTFSTLQPISSGVKRGVRDKLHSSGPSARPITRCSMCSRMSACLRRSVGVSVRRIIGTR